MKKKKKKKKGKRRSVELVRVLAESARSINSTNLTSFDRRMNVNSIGNELGMQMREPADNEHNAGLL